MGTTKKLSGKTMGYVILIGLVIVSWVIFKILTPHNFGSFSNMLNYFQASLIATVGAVGFYFVMVMGMFDFSIGANIMLSAIVGCVLATKFNLGYFGLIVGGILTGTIVGLLNGIFYVKLRIPSMIVTTGLALIYESLANYMAGGVEQTLPAHLRAFGRMPWDIILALVACVVAYIFLNYTKIGTYTYAIGSDEFVAKNMGINVNKYKVLAFILSGAFLGVMAILTISYGSSMVAVTGMASMSRNFVPTMGCFFGLAFKKYGMPLQAIIIGEFVINIIFFGFIALGAPTAIQDVITGFANKAHILSDKKRREFADKYAKQMSVKMNDVNQFVSNLSGGNKQKVVLARWIGKDSDIVVLDSPTRGIDIKVKQDIYQLMNQMRKNGKSIIMISEELMELIGMSDRIIIMKDGSISGELERNQNLDENGLISMMV